MHSICPICYQGLTRPYRARSFAEGGRLLPFPALIHFCPMVQPDAANEKRPDESGRIKVSKEKETKLSHQYPSRRSDEQ